MRKRFLSIIILVALIIVYMSDLGFASLAAPEKQITIRKLDDSRFEYTYRVLNSIELRGVNGENRWYFNVDKSLKVEDITLNLYYNLSSVIRSDVSYLTVYLNDIPVKSIRLRDNNEQLSKNVSIQLPASGIVTGYNNLKIVTYSRISDIDCWDDMNIANWIVIDGKSNYVINYNKNSVPYSISDFPSPFIGKFADNAQGIGFVIPKNYTDSEISAAVTEIAHLQAFQTDNNVKISLVRSDDPSIDSFDSLIYIGRSGGLPPSLSNISQGKILNSQNAGLLIGESASGKPAFLILSDDGDSLLNAVKALKNEDLKMQMEDSYIELTKNFNTMIKVDQTDDYISLSELGIKGIELTGAKRQVTNISVGVPFNEVISSDANIHLNYRYSDNLDYEKSYISISINGTPVGSQILSRAKKEGDELTLLIPDSLKKSSYYDIQVIFHLIPDGNLTCEQSLYANPWAYVDERTNLYLPTSDRALLQFENLPNPFGRNNDIDNTTIALPDNPNREDLQFTALMAKMMGIGVTNNQGVIKVAAGFKLVDNDYKNNLVFFGTPDGNSAIRAINGDLWFKYDDKFSQLLSNEKLELLSPASQTVTVFEIKESPYKNGKGFMTITSKSRAYMLNALQYFDGEKRALLIGDAAVITKNGEIATYRFQKEEDLKRPFVPNNILSSNNTRNYLIFAGLTMVVVIFGILMFFYKNRRK